MECTGILFPTSSGEAQQRMWCCLITHHSRFHSGKPPTIRCISKKNLADYKLTLEKHTQACVTSTYAHKYQYSIDSPEYWRILWFSKLWHTQAVPWGYSRAGPTAGGVAAHYHSPLRWRWHQQDHASTGMSCQWKRVLASIYMCHRILFTLYILCIVWCLQREFTCKTITCKFRQCPWLRDGHVQWGQTDAKVWQRDCVGCRGRRETDHPAGS